MSKSYRLLRMSRWVFIGLAYYFGVVVIGVLSGLLPLIVGGDPVPVLPVADSPTISARLFGALNLFLSAPISFLALHAAGSLIHLCLDIRDRLEGKATP